MRDELRQLKDLSASKCDAPFQAIRRDSADPRAATTAAFVAWEKARRDSYQAQLSHCQAIVGGVKYLALEELRHLVREVERQEEHLLLEALALLDAS